MASLTLSKLLEIWEQGHGLSPASWALHFLVRYSGNDHHQLGKLTVGQRDRGLCAIRQAMFGSHLQSHTDCPRCKAKIEVSVDLHDLATETLKESDRMEIGSWKIDWRVPQAEDLATISHLPDPQKGRQELMRRCLPSIRCHEQEVEIEDCPREILDRIEAEMNEADPGADIQFALKCFDCHHEWNIRFDITLFFRKELDRLMSRIFAEIHLLASTYGWHEADILAMSAIRRATYLKLCGS
jgi:hypothetical protein